MCHFGLLLAADHYPAVSDDPARMDAQLRHYLAANDLPVSRLTVFHCYRGDLPSPSAPCSAWIVSGAELIYDAESHDLAYRLRRLIGRLADARQPVFAMNCAEHILYDTLCADPAPRPATPATPRSVRNPFRSFWMRDRLYRYAPSRGTLEPLPRPACNAFTMPRWMSLSAA